MNRAFQNRCLLVCVVLVTLLSGLSVRLIQIQWVDRKHYAEKSRVSFLRTEKIPAMRGMIVDRREEPIASSVPVSTLVVDKTHLQDPKMAAFGLAYQKAVEEPTWNSLDSNKKRQLIHQIRGDILEQETPEMIISRHMAYAVSVLARPLALRREELRARIEESKGKWVAIAKDIPQDEADQLREIIGKNYIQGFIFENSIKRWYAAPNLATHLTGFVGLDETESATGEMISKTVGKFGIESWMEEYLAGSDGYRKHTRDARGMLVPGTESSLKPPRSGLNVQLTVDMGLQAIVEEELDAGLKEFESIRGAVVMINPSNGEVMAMASRPHFDLNLRNDMQETGKSYAIQAIYEPGSTIKVVAAAGALNEKLVTPNSSIFCHNGSFSEGSLNVRDDHPAGSLSFTQVLQKSNNIGTYKMARQLGQKRFYDYLSKFGFGKKTGIQLSGESRGVARNTGNAVDFSRASYGYATSVTPLQLACAYSVIAGDGNLRKPSIVKALIANDGTIVEQHEPEIVHRVLSENTARQMRKALATVTELGGTATRAAVPGYKVAGKTGTVQKHHPGGGYYENRYIVSFAGIMPAENPAFVCLVVIDDPQTKKITRYGGTIAAPIFQKIATRAAAYMNLQPTEPIPPTVNSTASR